MNSISEIRNDNVTCWGIEFYQKYKKVFGKIIKAELVYDSDLAVSKLILTNESREIMTLYGMTGGYLGSGPHGTIEVLNDAGFQVTDSFIFNNKSFILEK